MEHYCQFVAIVSDDCDIVRGTVRMLECRVSPEANLVVVVVVDILTTRVDDLRPLRALTGAHSSLRVFSPKK